MATFDGKTVLITGGGSGIGFATAKRIVQAGGNVVLAGRDAERLSSAAKRLDADDQVLAVPTDVSDLGELDNLIEQTTAKFAGLDGVFANAGVGLNARTADVTEADFDNVVGINFKGAYFTVQKSLPVLRPGSSIVFNASWLVHRAMGPGALYAATKAAVLNLSRSLATDLAGQGIRVNTVTPGHIKTEMFDAMTGNDQIRGFFQSMVTLNALGRPDDIADAVLFLLSERSAYVTGQELVVDGGLTTSVPG